MKVTETAPPSHDSLSLRDGLHHRRSVHDSEFVNELDIFYPVRRREIDFGSNVSSSLRAPCRLTRINNGDVDAMMDRLLSVHRLPDPGHYKE
jgi:hypothetical protein